MNAVRQCVLQIFELLFVALQDGRMQRYDLEGGWSFLQFCKNRLTLMVKFSRARTNYVGIAHSLAR